MGKEYIESEMLRVCESPYSLPKHGGIVAMLTDGLAKVRVGKTAECGPYAENGMGSLPREYVHNTQDVLTFE